MGSLITVRLSLEQEFLIVGFQGRSFSTPLDQMVYLYRLKGIDPDWRQTRQERVQYGSLPEGEYLFEVQAVDRMLNYSEPAVLHVKVD